VGPRTSLDDVERKKYLVPTGTRTPTPQPSNPQPVAIPTALSRLTDLEIYVLFETFFGTVDA
jgi:hypothetical protein